MKYTKIKKYTYLIGIGMSCFFSSCTKNFEDINTNPYDIKPKAIASDASISVTEAIDLFSGIQQSIYFQNPAWNTQLQQNLIADVYSGYLMPPTPFRGNANNMTYFLVNGWNGFAWNDAYNGVMSPSLKIQKSLTVDSATLEANKQYYALMKVLKVEAMHRVADIYGPIIYSKFGDLSDITKIPYDNLEDVYGNMFKDLDTAVLYFNQASGAIKTSVDLVYGGDKAKWIKFANSLRLRLAIRISKINASKAAEEGNKAIAAGMIESNTDNFKIALQGGVQHPLEVFSSSWADTRCNANIESILTGYADPRGTVFFENAGGAIHGVRQGISISSKATYENATSKLKISEEAGTKTYIVLMTAAEVQFLLAEAKLRGWNAPNTAQIHYEAGVKLSFIQRGLTEATAITYLQDNVKMAANYVDAAGNTQNNINGVNNVTIAWNGAGINEEKLQKIITQKWIAMFPEGQEAWSEFRRTGYPKLFPLSLNFSPVISSKTMIRRINFPVDEYTNNPGGIVDAVKYLGGDDNGATKLWWDTNAGTSNF